ncbi:hypothetical protein K59PH2_LOCUS15 [Klebsiella phage vB_Kpl_K59PH2]|uniref:Uncharacterized protein n=1 Tax=Klebsiella phage vB_Kpl_K59PH2 TaxID=3071671 RepID=A0AAD2GNM4_9CAUD|nr:hypothetical protein K59PH2_LOCUS15 [Klebsiella phage vB_Kpl_K59PH2]
MTAKITFKKYEPVLRTLRDIAPGEFFVSWAHGLRAGLQQRVTDGAVIVATGVYDNLSEYTEDAVFEVVPVEIIVG